MKYKNVSQQLISVKQSVASGDRSFSVQPGEEFLTSPVHAKALLEAGQIEAVSKAATEPVAEPVTEPALTEAPAKMQRSAIKSETTEIPK